MFLIRAVAITGIFYLQKSNSLCLKEKERKNNIQVTAISLTIPRNECALSLLRWGMWICGCHGHATLGIMPIFKNTYFSHTRAHKWQPASSCQPRRQWSRVIPNRVNCYLSHNCKHHWTALDQILLYLNVVPHPDNGGSEALLLQRLQGSVINHRSF